VNVETSPANPYARPADAVKEPPKGWLGAFKFLGPSFILIGSIVGSGELILTTSFGATIGFAGLWFIITACVCKTIVQAELGRYTISSGDTCLEAFDRLPGPRYRVSWFIWMYILWQIPGLINGGAILGSTGQVLSVAFPVLPQQGWAIVIATVNVALLLWGRYGFLEKASVFMVMSFSAITVFGAGALQFTKNAVPLEVALQGLQIQVAPLMATGMLAIAVSSFAGTGVGGGELMAYTYWCVEKGYARYAGEADSSADWVRRARGWVRVMQMDVWLATLIFTVGTVAFFWLGAGILHPQGLVPSNDQMISTLQKVYTQSLGPWAATLFLVGGFFVLYSTIFSGTAGTARTYADLLGVLKVVEFTDFHARMKWIRFFTIAVPVIQATTFAMHAKPKSVLILTAATNGLLLPIITFATIWLRYRLTDRRIAPTRWTDFLLWACAFIILAVSAVFLWVEVPKQFAAAFGG
jgi:Mn2+/Fe2+ NRAMP family transporter